MEKPVSIIEQHKLDMEAFLRRPEPPCFVVSAWQNEEFELALGKNWIEMMKPFRVYVAKPIEYIK